MHQCVCIYTHLLYPCLCIHTHLLCINVYVYVHIYVYRGDKMTMSKQYLGIYACIHVWIHACGVRMWCTHVVYACGVCMWCMHVCLNAWKGLYTIAYVRLYVHFYIHSYIHTYIHTHTHTHTHIQVWRSWHVYLIYLCASNTTIHISSQWLSVSLCMCVCCIYIHTYMQCVRERRVHVCVYVCTFVSARLDSTFQRCG
jgi:hypothetical protein